MTARRRITRGLPPLALLCGPMVWLLSTVAGAADPRPCLSCHGETDGPRQAPQVDEQALGRSVHAELQCQDCHPEAERLPHDPAPAREAWIGRCGKCHAKPLTDYSSSVHAHAVRNGIDSAPVCLSCHGDHGILSPRDKRSPVSPGRLARVCADCHDDPVVIGTADLPGNVVETYLESYHGVAQQHGITEAANCGSCHRFHAVLPSSDPRSSIHPDNLAETCGKCHGKVGRFVKDGVHKGLRPKRTKYWFQTIELFYPIANRALNPLLLAALGAGVGLLAGTFGVGGGFLLTPLLVFLGVPSAVAAATASAQIVGAGVSGALGHYRAHNVDLRVGLLASLGSLVGGTAGVAAERLLREAGGFDFAFRVLYVVMLGVVGFPMLLEALRSRPGAGQNGREQVRHTRVQRLFARMPWQMEFPASGIRTSALLPIATGCVVGLLAALMGVGGGFFLLPVLIFAIGMPTHVAVGTSLFQTTLASIQITYQQAIINQTVDVMLAVSLLIGAVIGAQVGARISQRVRGDRLRAQLAVIILMVMCALAYSLFIPPENLISLAKQAGAAH